MIKLKKHGSYLKLDKNGFVIPIKPSIQTNWEKPLQETIQFYQEELRKENIHSIYVRGSVAKGEAIDFISDLDTFCITHKDKSIGPLIEEKFVSSMKKKFPFCDHIETTAVSLEKVLNEFPPRKRSVWSELIKTQSVCIFGNNLANDLEPFELKDMIGHAYYLNNDLKLLPNYLEEDKESQEDIIGTCSWIMKRVVRSSFDLVMIEEKKFTRDLYLCYESFSKYYPSKKDQLRRILNLALNPTSNIQVIQKELDRFTPWLISEINSTIISR